MRRPASSNRPATRRCNGTTVTVREEVSLVEGSDVRLAPENANLPQDFHGDRVC